MKSTQVSNGPRKQARHAQPDKPVVSRLKPRPAPGRKHRSPAAPRGPAANGAANFTFYANPTLTLICLPEGRAALYSLAEAAYLTGVHPAMLEYYCRLGLITDQRDGAEDQPAFDEEALHEVRRIEHFRRHLGVSRRALPLICDLRREGERRQIALGFLGQS
jgi:hypothetical protein